MPTNGVIGMIFAALGTLWMLYACANITKEKFDKALAKEIDDSES
jgi:hypothetical protein